MTGRSYRAALKRLASNSKIIRQCLAGWSRDLIGEFFVLETLHDRDNPFAEPPHSWMPESAWRVRPNAMLDFVLRAKTNFPNHLSIKRIAITVRGVKESWLLAANSLIVGAQSADQFFTNVYKMLHAAAKSDVGAAEAFGEFTILVSIGTSDFKLSVVTAFLDGMAALHAAHAEEPALRRLWAASVANFIRDRAGADPAYCQGLLKAVRALQAAHPEEPALREEWAASVRNFIGNRAAKNTAGCGKLLDEMAALHAAHAEEPALRQLWAESVYNFVHQNCGWVSGRPQTVAYCRLLLHALMALQAAHADEPALYKLWEASENLWVESGGPWYTMQLIPCRGSDGDFLDALRRVSRQGPAAQPRRTKYK